MQSWPAAIAALVKVTDVSKVDIVMKPSTGTSSPIRRLKLPAAVETGVSAFAADAESTRDVGV